MNVLMNWDDEAPKSRMMRELDAMEKPREKALAYGIDSLTDKELMAIIFSTGVKGKSVIELCTEILEANDGHISLVAKMSVDEICRDFRGIGPVKAITLLAALKLGERAEADAQQIFSSSPITSADIAYKQIRGTMRWLQHEEFWVMLINRAGKKIKSLRISQGGTSATIVDIKIILRNALKYSAEGMILFHNHPSGTLEPSRQDDLLTQKIVEAAKVMDLRVFDHIIVTDTNYYSYTEHGKL